ncbi:type 1 glutamine amidotransferase [uncultured Enterovirga sp.]|uniref:glutamine amidotransferase-related protein n=1 Tax=uncultured Enterovirga sp. TaxID=2026352 RepID=UPI0035C960B6
MKIGILEAGVPPADLASRFGRYDAMTADLLGAGFDTVTYRVRDGELPPSPEACAGYVVTGSAAGVYDDLPWIAPLRAFLREAKGRAKLVGICFGHQIMAEAFGGRVVKSDKGWGLGLQRYDIREQPSWADPVPSFAIPASHQDQVVAPPPATRILAGSAFAPFSALIYDDQPAISFQGHPEFTPAYAKALLALCHAERLEPGAFGAVTTSLDGPNDCARIGSWIGRFLLEGRARLT